MVATVEIREMLRKLTIRELILLYLASRYPDWVHYKEIIDFVLSIRDANINNLHNVLKRLLHSVYGHVDRMRTAKTAIFYRINERGLKWLRYKIYVEGKIPFELKVPAIDLVRVELKDGRII